MTSGGKVCEVPVDNVDTFLGEEKFVRFSKTFFEELFLDAGRKAYLRAMGIPPSFFEKQPTTLQSDILTSQKSFELREKSDGIYILVDGDSHVAYAGAATEAGWQDPYESFGIDQEKWIPTRVDGERGLFKFVQRPAEVDEKQYFPSTHLVFSMFHTSPITVGLGLYKLVCANGMIDEVNCSSIKINASSFSGDVLGSLVRGISDSLEGLVEGYKGYFDWMESKEVTYPEARGRLFGMQKEKVIPKKLVVESQRHLDFVENEMDLEQGAPERVDNLYELQDTLTFFSQRLKTLPAQIKADSGIFSHFYGEYRKEVGLYSERVDLVKFVSGE